MRLPRRSTAVHTAAGDINANDPVRISLRENETPGALCEVDGCDYAARYQLPAPELVLSGSTVRTWFGTCERHTISLLEGQRKLRDRCRG